MRFQTPSSLAPFINRFQGKIRLPPEEATRRLLEVAFYAGLERDEGRDLSFTLVFLAPEEIDTPQPGPRPGLTMAVRPEFGALTFEKPLPLSVREISKLAPAVDPQRAAIGVRKGESELEIWGLYRHGSSEFLRLEGQVSGSVGLGLDFLRVTCNRPGSLLVDVGDRRIAEFSRGRITTGGGRVFFDKGLVQSTLLQRAEDCGLHGGDYLQSVQQIVWTMRQTGHGGTLLLVPDMDPSGLRPGRYQVAAGSSAQVDLRQRCAERREAMQVNSDRAVAAHQASRSRQQNVAQLHVDADAARAALQVATRAYQDSVKFAATLAEVDGALVLGPDLCVITLGAMIEGAENVVVEGVLCGDPHGASEGPLSGAQLGGARHQSAVQFVFTSPHAMAFVVSQDGGVSCLYNDGERLLAWRHIRLDRRADPPA